MLFSTHLLSWLLLGLCCWDESSGFDMPVRGPTVRHPFSSQHHSLTESLSNLMSPVAVKPSVGFKPSRMYPSKSSSTALLAVPLFFPPEQHQAQAYSLPNLEHTTSSSLLSSESIGNMMSTSSSSSAAGAAFISSLASTKPTTAPVDLPKPLTFNTPSMPTSTTVSVLTNAFTEEEAKGKDQFFQTPTTAATVPPEKSLRHLLGVDTRDSAVTKSPVSLAMSATSLGDTMKDARTAYQMPSASFFGPSFRQERPKIVGHRGALYDYLENTRPAFVRCADLGCDGIELDVFQIADGNLVVFHGGGGDVTPGDLSGHCFDCEGKSIMDLTYEECRNLKFVPTYEAFPCPKQEIEAAQVPLLSQVLEDLRGKNIQVKIELKGPGVVKPVLDLVESMDMANQCCYSSFQHNMLRELRDLRPDTQRYPSGALFAGELPANYLEQAKDCGATEVHVRYDFCTAKVVQEIHNAGFGSMVWFRGPIGMAQDTTDKYWDVGNEDEACYQALFDTGVQQVCLNRPSTAMPMLQQYDAMATLKSLSESNSILADSTTFDIPPILPPTQPIQTGVKISA